MRRANAAIGSSVFFIAAPTVVAGLLPWWLTRWEVRQPPLSIPFGMIGVAAIVVGAGVLILAFVRFVVEGSGTPAPVAPTEQLVIGGLYRYVRNPMYLAVLSIIVGQALLLGHASLFTYAGVVAFAFVSFTRLYEEPTLRRQFGEEYETYRRAVPGWWPRLRPFKPDGEHVARTTSRNSPW